MTIYFFQIYANVISFVNKDILEIVSKFHQSNIILQLVLKCFVGKRSFTEFKLVKD